MALAAVVVVALTPFYHEIWRLACYRQEHSRDFTVTIHMRPPQEYPAYVVFMRKRFAWLPGPEQMALCGWCVDSEHRKCPRVMFNPEPDPETGELRGQPYRCSCDDPVHPHGPLAPQEFRSRDVRDR